MENQSLRKRLYQNLSHRPLKHTFLLQTQTKDPRNSSGILKPKILQESINDLKGMSNMSNSGILNTSSILKTQQLNEKKKQKPQKVQLQKLSKQAKGIVEDGKSKIRSNLKPNQIFAFYDTFPEMVEDFFYLNRMSHPYDYQIVSYAKRNHHEYMTISSQGVTLYHDKQAQFLTRDQWLSDEKTFYQLQKIDFFNQYKISKNFMIWKNKMKRHYMKSMSNILCQKLFLTYQHPRKCLKNIRQFSLGLQDFLTLLPSQKMQPSSWEQLLDLTNAYHSSSLINKVDQFEKKIITTLEQAIDLQIANFKQNNKIKIEGLNTKQENKEGYVYSQQAILRKQYKRVLKLIKLAQSILLQSKIQLIKRWLQQILQKLKEVAQNNLRDDWVTIIFVAQPPEKNSTQIKWCPNYDSFVGTFKNIISKAVSVICQKHEKVMNHPVFQKYRSSEQQSMNRDDRHNSLKNLIQESAIYNDLSRQIRQMLESQYSYVKKQEEELKKFIQIYIKHKNMPPLPKIIEESTAAEISSYVREWKQDNIQMQDLPDKCMGMIKFDYSLIRKSMMSVAYNSSTELISLLPQHLAKLCQITEDKTNALLRPINYMKSDSNFVQFTKAVKRASADMEQIIESGKQIKQLFILLEQNKSSNIETLRTNIKNLSNLISDLNNKVTEAEAKQDQRLNTFKRQLEVTIKKIKGNIKQFLVKLQQIELDQKDIPSQTIIERISVILPIIVDLDKQAHNINGMESQLGLNQTDFSQSHTLFSRAEVLNSLWKQKKLWNQFKKTFYITHYSAIDCDQQMKKWHQFNTQASNIRKVLDDNQFLNQLITQVEEVQQQIQLIRAFQSKSLNQKSWNQISEYLVFQFDKKQCSQYDQNFQPFKNPKDSIYTVEWIREKQICQYKQKIQMIVKKSERECHLTSVLGILKNYINGLTLQFVPKKRQLLLLGENLIVFQQLSQHLESLLDIFNFQFSDNLKKQTKALVKHYQYVIQILQNYKDFGKNWQKYEQLFDPAKNYSKQLGKQSKDFGNLEITWKKLIKGFTMQNWSKKMFDQTSGVNPNKNTLKSIYKANTLWQQIRKGVQQFLDRRRNSFHHYFYFSDDQLLSFMTKTDGHFQLNSIVPLIYDNIKTIKISKQSDCFQSVVNMDGEQLKINKPISSKIVAEVQQLLKNCEQQWKKSLVGTIRKVLSDFISLSDDKVSKKRIIAENICQVILVFEHIVWVKLAQETYLCPEPLGSLKDWVGIQSSQISELYEIFGQQITTNDHKKISQLLIQAIYLRDKTEFLFKTNVQSVDTYEWERTLKLCQDFGSIHEKVYLRSLGSCITYGGEICNLSNSVFVTPETERSYLNLIQTIQQRQIGIINSSRHNLETMKSFSCLVAQNFKTFSFCEGVSFKMIDRALAAICYQGLWACLTPPSNWETLSFIASHLSVIQKCISQNNYTAQLSKYSITINQTNPPIFFLKVYQSDLSQIKKLPKANYRSISFVKPNVKTILTIKSQIYDKDPQVVQVICQLADFCQKLFKQNLYEDLSFNFAMKILDEFISKGHKNNGNIVKKISDLFLKMLNPRLKLEDQNTLMALLQVFNVQSQQKVKAKRFMTMDDLGTSKTLLIGDQPNLKYGQIISKDSCNLYEMMVQGWNKGKKSVIVGPNFSGKTTLIQYLKAYLQQKQKKSIQVHTIYFQAFKQHDLLYANDKGLGLIGKCLQSHADEDWIVLDGPLNQKYNKLFRNLNNEAIISNFGVIREVQSQKKLRVFFQTTNLSNATPDFVNDHSVLYVEENPKRIQEIIRCSIMNFMCKTHQEEARTETKMDDTNFEIKTYRIRQKPIGLSKQSLQCLITQMVSLIQRFAPKGYIKIKSVQLLYEVSAVQLAYRSAKLVECIFAQNWDTIKQKQKNKKTIQKFAIWAVIWSISPLVNPEDKQKFHRSVSQILRCNSYDQLVNSIVYPGSGLEIYSLNSQRVQSALSCIPTPGDITNMISRYNGLFDAPSTANKNKFEKQFYFDEPHSIRVVTQEAAIFTYFSLINRHSKIPVAVYGPPVSGKKSIIDIFNKNSQQSIESYSFKFKRHDPYYISKQLQKPFIKFEGFGKSFYKPSDISKRIHITIDDVSMDSETRPAVEILRMFINKGSIIDDKFNQVQFRQCLLSITIDQIAQCNSKQLDLRRLLSKFFIIQTSKITKQKLTNIFNPILQNLCCQFWQNDNSQKQSAFVNKNGQNIIVNSTVGVYSFIQDLINQFPCQTVADRNKKLLLTPKIQQICNVITNICQVQQPEQYSMAFFAELWSHEILRVFGDKLTNKEHSLALNQQIKKYSFMQFKHSFSIPSSGFIFTNLCPQQVGEGQQPKYPYMKCQNLADIDKEIEDLLEKQNIPLPTSLITDQFIEQLLKVYRILKMPAGHLLIATPFIKSAKSLVKIGSLLTKFSLYHDIEQGNIQFDLHIAPSILRDVQSHIMLNLSTTTKQTLYQLTCLMNRNICQFDIRPELKQKMKMKFVTIALQSSNKQNQNLQTSFSVAKSKAGFTNEAQNQDSIRSAQIQLKIQQQFLQIVSQCYNQYMHVIACVHPYKPQTTKFLNENISMVKRMQVSWYEFKNQTIYSIGQKTLQRFVQIKQSNMQIFNKCKLIYELLTDQQKADADFLKLFQSCNSTYQATQAEFQSQLAQFQQCLLVVQNNLNQLEQQKGKSQQIQKKIQQLVKNQQQISLKIKSLQDIGETKDIEELQNELKKIKNQKDNLDLKSRQTRTFEKMCEDCQKHLPSKSQIEEKQKQTNQIKNKCQQYVILVQSALLYLNNHDKSQYISQFNNWIKFLGLQTVSQISQILDIFQKVFGIEYIKIPGWQKYSEFAQLKGIHFCQNFLTIPQSAFGSEPIVAKDQKALLSSMLSSISDKSSSISMYSNCKLISFMAEKKEKNDKRQYNEKVTRDIVFGAIQKDIQKTIGQLKNEGKYDSKGQNRKGIIMVGKNYNWQPSRNDIDVLERKLIRDKKLSLDNRVVIVGDNSPNISFFADQDDLKRKLIQRSMRMEFGDSMVNQNDRVETFIRQLTLQLQLKRLSLIQICTTQQGQEKVLQNVLKVQNEIVEMQKTKKKIMAVIEQRNGPSDLFLINWLLNIVNEDKQNNQDRILQIYEFLKKCLMQINCGREQKIQKMQQIEAETLKNWVNLIKTNVLEGDHLELNNLVKFYMPLQQKQNLVIIPQSSKVEKQIKSKLHECSYPVKVVDMHSNHSEAAQTQQQSKNLWIFTNFIETNPQHIAAFLDHYEKNKDSYCPVTIVISNNSQNLYSNLTLQSIFNISKKDAAFNEETVSQMLQKIINGQVQQRKQLVVESPKILNKKTITQQLTPNAEGCVEQESNSIECSKIKDGISKFLNIIIGSDIQNKKNNTLTQLSSKNICSKLKLIKNVSEAKLFIKDIILNLPNKWETLLTDLIDGSNLPEQSTQQLDMLFMKYSNKVVNENSDTCLTINNKQMEMQYVSYPAYADIEDRLNNLPFSFNCQDFVETNQVFNVQLINRAHAFNQRRSFLKKYLQQCLKIIKGTQFSYLATKRDFGLQLPTKKQINKINNDYKTIKRCLQMVGLISNVDMSSKDIKVTNSSSMPQLQSILSVACQSFDCRNLEGVSQRLIIKGIIKAAKKLKITVQKMKIGWRLISSDATVEQPVNGQVCMCFNAKIGCQQLFQIQKAMLPKQAGSVKLLLMLYDPTPIPALVHQAPKQQCKKDKQKKTKQQQAKPATSQMQHYQMEIPIRITSGNIVGNLNLPLSQEYLKYRAITQQPCFALL